MNRNGETKRLRWKLKTVIVYLKSLLKKRKRPIKQAESWANEIINIRKVTKGRNRKEFKKRRVTITLRRIT